MNFSASSPNLECYTVTDASVVSSAVQGMGYDPEPAPSAPSVSATGLWWGDTVTFSGSYLDPTAKGNIAEMYDQPVRADSVSGGPPYATAATFTIPDDARSFNAFIQAHGRTCSTTGVSAVGLRPRGIGPFSNIHGVAYAPQSGHALLAADGVVEEINIFQHDPAVVSGRTWLDLSKPYISRVTNSNTFLMVDGVNGVTTVYQVDLSSGTRTSFASTHDAGFTRNIWPVGIAADPDGSACYIADSNLGLVVKIPAGAGGGATIIDNWGDFTWNFPDPCGMDVAVGHQVAVSSADEWTGYIPDRYNTWLYGYTSGVPYSLMVDRDVSSTGLFYVIYSNNYGVAEGFNLNPIGPNSPAYHEGTIFGLTDGYLAVDPTMNYAIYHHWPQRVVLNNAGQAEPYPSQFQSQDRVIAMLVEGWGGRKVRLRVIDPPDLSPYAPDGGCLQGGCTQTLPYEANDNIATSGFGVGLQPDGSDAAPSGTFTFPSGADITDLVFYLTVPARYVGDNFQVEATKCNYYGTVLPQRVMGLSAVYTSWKRVFVERDKMFRRGGLLYADFDPSSCSPNCDQITVFDWTNASVGDEIVVVDEAHGYESTGEKRTITNISAPSGGARIITLNSALSNYYHATGHDSSTPPLPTFANGHSGGFGVTYSTVAINGQTVNDTSPNQINATGSAFCDADMRGIEFPFDDAYVEFFGLRSGMEALPYIAPAFFSGYRLATGASCSSPATERIPGYDFAPMYRFGWTWFRNHGVPNYMWLCGAGETAPLDVCTIGCSGQYSMPQYLGLTSAASQESFVFSGHHELYCSYTPNGPRENTNHELAHNFFVNPAASDLGHDYRCQWTVDGAVPCSTTAGNCGTPATACLMNPTREIWANQHRLDRYDLLCGDASCPNGNPGCCNAGAPGCTIPGNGAIRQLSDSVQGVTP